MASVPLVSVVVPCYGQAAFLPEAVGSVVVQTYPRWELVVVDDGSPDDTAAVAERLIGSEPDCAIRLVRRENGGLPAARNTGIEAAAGEYVVCLDADDRLTSGYLAACVGALEADPEISIAYGCQQNFGEDTAFHPHPEYDFRTLTRQNLLGVASMFRRRAWEDAGGYDPRFDSYEDWDFWISCGERGHVGRRVPEAVFEYRVRSGSMFDEARRRDGRLKAQVVLKHPRLYAAEEVAWAAARLADEPGAVEADTELYVVPRLGGAGPHWTGSRLDGLRGRAVVALADELRAEPALLRAWTDCVSELHDLTLVVVGALDAAGDVDPGLAEPLDRSDADVLALPQLDERGLALLVQHADALYSAGAAGGVLAALPRISEPLAA